MEDQHGTVRALRLEPCGLPLLFDPLATPQRRFVGGRDLRRELGRFDDLLDERGLRDLPQARDDLDEAAWLA